MSLETGLRMVVEVNIITHDTQKTDQDERERDVIGRNEGCAKQPQRDAQAMGSLQSQW